MIGRLLSLCAVLAAAFLLALPPGPAAADAACPPEIVGQLANVNRAIVPIGVTVTRAFQVEPGGGAVVTGLQLSAPAEYGATQIAVGKSSGLRLKAPRAGTFAVQGTWSAKYNDHNGDDQTCSASATSTLNASHGTPLKLRPPAIRKFPGVPGTQYDLPLQWSWKCSANTDPTPLTATVRWEIDKRQLPLFSRGGHAPFRFRPGSKSFTIYTGDPCEAGQIASVKRTLQQKAKLQATLGGSVGDGGGSFGVGLGGAIGGSFTARGHMAPFHLGVTLKQATRTLLNAKLCAWYHESGFLLARGKNISCWW